MVKETRFWIPWKTLTFLFILVWSTRLGDPRSSPNAFFLFSLNFLIFRSFGTKRMWDRSPTTSFSFILFFLKQFSFDRKGVDRTPTTHFIFLLNFLYSAEMSSDQFPRDSTFIFLLILLQVWPIVCGFKPHNSHFYFSLSFSYFGQGTRVQIPHATFFFYHFIFKIFNIVRSPVKFSVTSLIFSSFYIAWYTTYLGLNSSTRCWKLCTFFSSFSSTFTVTF